MNVSYQIMLPDGFFHHFLEIPFLPVRLKASAISRQLLRDGHFKIDIRQSYSSKSFNFCLERNLRNPWQGKKVSISQKNNYLNKNVRLSNNKSQQIKRNLFSISISFLSRETLNKDIHVN